jgi:hypothetical protein
MFALMKTVQILGVVEAYSGVKCVTNFVITNQLHGNWKGWEKGGLCRNVSAGCYNELTLCRVLSWANILQGVIMSQHCRMLPLASTLQDVIMSQHSAGRYHDPALCRMLSWASNLQDVIMSQHSAGCYHEPAPCRIPWANTLQDVIMSQHSAGCCHEPALCRMLSGASNLQDVIMSQHSAGYH